MASLEESPPPPYEMVISGDWNLQFQPNYQHQHQQPQHQQSQQQQQQQRDQQPSRTRDVQNTAMIVTANSTMVKELETLQKRYISLERKYRERENELISLDRKYRERENELTEVRKRNIELVQKCCALQDELGNLKKERRRVSEDQTSVNPTVKGASGQSALTALSTGLTPLSTGLTGYHGITQFLGVNSGSEGKNSFISGNVVDFMRYSTVSVPRSLIPASLKVKVWYEVRVMEYTPPIKDNYLCLGWAPEKFRSCDLTPRGVGDPAYPVNNTGYGLSFRLTSENPYEACSYVRGPGSSWTHWGRGRMSTRGGSVIGVALDKVNMRVMFSMNGNWDEPMGVAYSYVSPLQNYFPAVTACQVKVQINIGRSHFLHEPPDSSFFPVGGKS